MVSACLILVTLSTIRDFNEKPVEEVQGVTRKIVKDSYCEHLTLGKLLIVISLNPGPLTSKGATSPALIIVVY